MVAGLAVFLFAQYKMAGLDYSEKLELPINEKVDVFFDDFGVPHIYAQNERDAYYAFGYIISSERYFQADMMRRIGKGRLSEVFGDKLLETDKLFRTLGIEEHSLRSLNAIDKNAEYYKLTEEYLRGFNEAVELSEEPLEYKILGIEREKFDLTDLMAIAAYMAFNFDKGLKNDPYMNKFWRDLGEDYMSVFNPHQFHLLSDSLLKSDQYLFSTDSLTALYEQLPVAPFLGSNAWVVSPEKSASGSVLFSNDTHIRNSQPATWYEAHIEYPGFSFYGNYLPGIPFALIGHTRNHAWGLTMLQNDDTDLFKEQYNSESGEYFHKGEWKKFKVRKETIKVKDAEDVVIEIRESVHGPIVNDILKIEYEQPIAMHWNYTQFPNELVEVFYDLAKADDMKDVEKAASRITAPGLNMAYGDSEGNIALWACAKLIKRDSLYSQLLLPGTGEYDIEEYYDFSENPKYVNPQTGFLRTANQDHGMFQGRLHQGYYASMDRANTIQKFLDDKEKLSISDLKELAYSNVNEADFKLNNFLVQHIHTNELNKTEAAALELLKDWKGAYSIESKGALVFQNFKFYLLKNVFEDELGEDFNEFVGKSDFKRGYKKGLKDFKSIWWEDADLNNTPQDIITMSFKKAIENIIEKKGNDSSEWEWGKCHYTYFGHPIGNVKPFDKLFDVGPFPSPGNSTTVNAQAFKLDESCNYRVSSGPQMRIMIDFNDVESAESILPVGQSGNPSSDFYSNQAEQFVAGNYRKMHMNKAEITTDGRKIVIHSQK